MPGGEQVCRKPATKKKRTEGANRKFYHKEILVTAYQAQGNVLLPKPTIRKLPLDLALGKHCNQQVTGVILPLVPRDLR